MRTRSSDQGKMQAPDRHGTASVATISSSAAGATNGSAIPGALDWCKSQAPNCHGTTAGATNGSAVPGPLAILQLGASTSRAAIPGALD